MSLTPEAEDKPLVKSDGLNAIVSLKGSLAKYVQGTNILIRSAIATQEVFVEGRAMESPRNKACTQVRNKER